MMGCHEKPTISLREFLVPPQRHGVKLMSIGFLVDGDQPVIWRGPMITKTIQQFLFSVEWADLDYLLVDLPPGTGDASYPFARRCPRRRGGGHNAPRGFGGRRAQGHCHVLKR